MRRMHRTTAVALSLAGVFFATIGLAADDVHLFVATPLPKAAQLALDELQAALRSHGVVVRNSTARPPDEATAIIVGAARGSATFDELLADAKVEVSDLAESSTVAWAEGRKQTLVIAGGDERGLTYALRDAARGISLAPHAPDAGNWTKGVTPAVESPYLRVRNVSLHLFNADCELEWFFSEEFWRFYFARLSLSRFNRCTLTFCDQTNYLCPPYAYLVAMPEYPQVRIEDCTPKQREANLAMLRRITELADEYAIDFDLGIWMQAPVPKWAAPVKVNGLPEGLALADYCALGLRRVYESCPSLDGVQLRMNAEAGVSEDQQTEFYKPLFAALAATGRLLRVELRYKGLQQATIDAAVAAGLDVTVSTKFWAEHFGLPYHPTVVDSHYAKDRYSYGTLLRKPRNYRVTYQLWTVGSQRVTLWGDPEYAARFAKSCTLGGGEGFEVFAPLTNKGYGNAPGAWQVIKNPEYRVGRWEQERYWMFYLCFGRLGYNPSTNPEIWKREFRHRFGEAAKHVEAAYKSASRVLPLITAMLLPSASEWSWWPEMDTGGNLADYSRIPTGDPGRIAALRQWDPTPTWRWEEWDRRPGILERRADHSDDGGFSDRWLVMTYLQMSAHTLRGYWDGAVKRPHETHAEWRITEADFHLLAGLAEYHYEKQLLAFLYAQAEITGKAWELSPSGGQGPRDAWMKIIAATDGVYHDNLVFGVTSENARNKFGHHHSGHWCDRLAEIEAAFEPAPAMKQLLPDAVPPQEQVNSTAKRYGVSHEAADSLHAGHPLRLRVQTGDNYGLGLDGRGPSRMTVWVRSLDQTRPWREFPLTPDRESEDAVPPITWSASVPSEAFDPQYDVQYFFTLYDTPDRARRWPQIGLDTTFDPPYFVVPVEE